MLNWSDITYKYTLGFGAIGLAALLADLWKQALPTWLAILMCLVPPAIFIFVHPDELPSRIVWIAHVFASVWYLALAFGLLMALSATDPLPHAWWFFTILAAAGAIPCIFVLYRAALGTYRLSEESANVPVEHDPDDAHAT